MSKMYYDSVVWSWECRLTKTRD